MPDRDSVSSCVLSLTLFMFLLALAANMTPVLGLHWIAHQSTTVVSEPERRGILVAGTPHGPIAIDGDANFSDTAQREGWDGDGSPENPYMIDGLDIDLGDRVGHCMSISNTRVSFTMSNCNLTGASVYPGAGIYLENVRNGELVENIVDGNHFGIYLYDSDHNTMANNTCSSNTEHGICLFRSNLNSVSNNTCSSNGEYGIYLLVSDSNIVTDNTCSNNNYGIYLDYSHSNQVVNNTYNRNGDGIRLDSSTSNTLSDNTCNSNGNGNGIYLHHNSTYNTVVKNICNNNERGIFLYDSDSNIVANNTCTNNRIGIFLNYSRRNTVVNNTCNNNELGILLYDSDTITEITEEFDSVVLLLIGVVGITLLGAGWWKVSVRGGQDEIIIPTRYRLVSWLRKRRSIKHLDVDESREPDSSDQ